VSAAGPVFVDLHGVGPAPDPAPVWIRCWKGTEPLWRVFWGWFFFGHGAMLGGAFGLMLIAMVFGFVVSSDSLDAGMTGLTSGAALVVLISVPYAFWSAVSVWRCAYNCIDKRWGHMARLTVAVYAMMILLPIGKNIFLYFR